MSANKVRLGAIVGAVLGALAVYLDDAAATQVIKDVKAL
jgi:hypothetical protein